MDENLSCITLLAIAIPRLRRNQSAPIRGRRSGWSFISRGCFACINKPSSQRLRECIALTMLPGDSSKMFSYLRVLGTSNGRAKLQDHCAICLQKLLIGLFCLRLFAQDGATLALLKTQYDASTITLGLNTAEAGLVTIDRARTRRIGERPVAGAE